MSRNWYRGNAVDDGQANHGWLVGHFMEPSGDVRSTKDVEVKWAIHPAGEKRLEWAPGDQRTTMVILVRGRFRVDLPEESADLVREGDYVVFGPGVGHSYEAAEDSIVVAIRWPSSL